MHSIFDRLLGCEIDIKVSIGHSRITLHNPEIAVLRRPPPPGALRWTASRYCFQPENMAVEPLLETLMRCDRLTLPTMKISSRSYLFM